MASTVEARGLRGDPESGDEPRDAASGMGERPSLVEWLGAFRYCMARSRFSVLVLAVGLALVLSDQGRDLLVAYREDGKTVRLALAAFGWATSIWWWSRVLLDIRHRDVPTSARAWTFWRKWLARALGAAAFLVVALGAWEAHHGPLVTASLVALAVFLVVVVVRRPVARAAASRLERSGSRVAKRTARLIDVAQFGPPPHGDLRSALRLERRAERARVRPAFVIAVALLLSFCALAAAAWTRPVWLGARSGALLLFLVWAITWLPIGSAMSYVADRYGIPVLTGLLVLALVSSSWNDNHRIRARDGALPARPSIATALAEWSARNPQGAPDEEMPFVIVATAGGGIRAAYWTATVLGELHDTSPAFRDRLFAISGVSGGSVGATVYRALRSVEPAALRARCGKMRTCGQAVLEQEFLGPLAAALLFPDLAQRFFPVAAFPDRATALEQSWEAAFRNATGSDGLQASLAALSSAPGPHLFLNATWAENGRRIVASDLRFGLADATFPRSNDQLAVLGHDLRLSTAAHNSARFPYVSPPGSWTDATGAIAGRLQDGGMFENYGAETAIELLEYACDVFSCGETPAEAGGRRRILPLVVIITSDPSLSEGFAASPRVPPLSFGYEVRTTIWTYERVRSGRGADSAARLLETAARHGGGVFELRMCGGGEPVAAEPPLGWALSDGAKSRIQSYLLPDGAGVAPRCQAPNARAAASLVALLEARGGAPP